MTIASGYVPHAPNLIVANANVTLYHGVTDGSGTLSDPYRIQGWGIDASQANGIEIRDTDACFMIRQVYLNASVQTYTDILLEHVTHGPSHVEGGVPSCSCDWSFGDDSHSTVPSPTHTFTAAGNYIVALTVHHAEGHLAVATTTVSVDSAQGVGGRSGISRWVPLVPLVVGSISLSALVFFLMRKRSLPACRAVLQDWSSPTSAILEVHEGR